MTNADIEQFGARLSGLYESITPEQLGVWIGYVRKHHTSIVESALNEYYATEKRQTPNLRAFLAVMHRLAGDSRSSSAHRCHSSDSQFIHALRHQWMNDAPEDAGAINSMPADDITLRYLHGCYENAFKTYGTDPRHIGHVRRAFEVWQGESHRHGYPALAFEDAVGVMA